MVNGIKKVDQRSASGIPSYLKTSTTKEYSSLVRVTHQMRKGVQVLLETAVEHFRGVRRPHVRGVQGVATVQLGQSGVLVGQHAAPRLHVLEVLVVEELLLLVLTAEDIAHAPGNGPRGRGEFPAGAGGGENLLLVLENKTSVNIMTWCS